MAAQAVRDGGATMLEPGAGLITNQERISQNPNSFGFALEHLQAIGFNLNAALTKSEVRAYQIPVDGLKYGPDIYVDKQGQLIAQFQVKAGSTDYVERVVTGGHYAEPIITNAENGNITGASSTINIDGVQSIPIPLNLARFAAEHPYSFSWLLETAANVGEVAGAGVSGATINASINVVHASIHQLGAYCRGESKLDGAVLRPILMQALAGIQSGFMRGAAVKVLQRLMGGNAAAVFGVAIASEAIPLLIQLIQGKTTLNQALKTIGPRILTSGLLTVMILLFPPVGLALTTASVIQAIWIEITPEWKAAFQDCLQHTAKAVGKGVDAAKQELALNPWNWLGSSSASIHASAAEMLAQETLLDELLGA
ncbi:hypothetical protein [Leptothoe sp. PORK10 BA2]|uniref:hypothetical protein n=1 Tax=Leptothoe sp. PORK10 BA2 TaxID=3110254 RepID=UPI002B20464C|nr:hypothetical protein [Leptothoe sp. PORK10 BA2]MEA5462813.1 hypothetical protein [Leptothoe sp. PORK10 BA2]